MNQNRARDNELQRAIDEITRKAAPASTSVVAPGQGGPVVMSQPAQSVAVPPVVQMESKTGVAANSLPPKPVEGAPVEKSVEKPAMPVPPSISSIVAGAQPEKKPADVAKPMGGQNQPKAGGREVVDKPGERSGADTRSVREAALMELFPIMDRIEVEPKKRFALYREMMEVMHDKAVIKPAHEAAKKIKDDKARADALLYLIEEIEKLG